MFIGRQVKISLIFDAVKVSIELYKAILASQSTLPSSPEEPLASELDDYFPHAIIDLGYSLRALPDGVVEVIEEVADSLRRLLCNGPLVGDGPE